MNLYGSEQPSFQRAASAHDRNVDMGAPWNRPDFQPRRMHCALNDCEGEAMVPGGICEACQREVDEYERQEALIQCLVHG